MLHSTHCSHIVVFIESTHGVSLVATCATYQAYALAVENHRGKLNMQSWRLASREIMIFEYIVYFVS